MGSDCGSGCRHAGTIATSVASGAAHLGPIVLAARDVECGDAGCAPGGRSGWLLHPVDLAINKVLALVGRDEPRDFVDILFINARVLPLGAVCWAAAGKDHGFTPLSLPELLKRRGRYRPEEFARLDLAEPFDLIAAKTEWLAALDSACE